MWNILPKSSHARKKATATTTTMKVFLSPDITLCDWLGLEHQLTNCFMTITARVNLAAEFAPPWDK